MRIRLYRHDLATFKNYILIRDDEDFHYLINVIKIQTNDIVNIFSETIEIEFQVQEILKKSVILTPIKQINITENKKIIDNLAFILPIIKSDKLHLIAKQIVEIGFGNIFPIQTNFSKEPLKHYKESKFFLHLKEAMEQSEGFYFPKLHQMNKFDKVIKNLSDFTILYGDFSSNAIPSQDFFLKCNYLNNLDNSLDNIFSQNMQSLIRSIKEKKKIAVLIGPEGGLSENEVNLLKISKCFGINLGERKQRCETASIYLMSIAKNLLINNG